MPPGEMYEYGCEDLRPRVPLVRPGMFWGDCIQTWQCPQCGKPSINTCKSGLLVEASVARSMNALHDEKCPLQFDLRDDELYYVAMPRP